MISICVFILFVSFFCFFLFFRSSKRPSSIFRQIENTYIHIRILACAIAACVRNFKLNINEGIFASVKYHPSIHFYCSNRQYRSFLPTIPFSFSLNRTSNRKRQFFVASNFRITFLVYYLIDRISFSQFLSKKNHVGW